jgi:hypothetical protein
MPSHTHGLGTLNSDGSFPVIDKKYSDGPTGGFFRDAGPDGSWGAYLKGSENGDNWGTKMWYDWARGATGSLGNTGGGQAHENRPPYIVMNYIIKIR